ncbi:stage II sporulation protein P [Psychrobacillus psychrotolerans]|uniref:Stage II sporulation protein P n=1 Tax=Psychrobacillus psychrotolerans TaxID=126156 RepID=A0A1I6B439_9BACI|nr:stage II sporulation protein P [Psychrobacillus psychrotolerans]SFQ75711.1 stage II sporulation protein P [Psychrobacillus psychrotolerans]
MAKSLKNVVSILLLLFLAPIIIATVQTPLFPQQKLQTATEQEAPPKEESKTAVVYAAQLDTKTAAVSEILEPKKAFVYFTHSQEAFKPMLAAKGDKIATYHPENNITSFQEQITSQFAFHQLETDILGPETTGDARQYNSIRPFVQEALAHDEYDIVLDLHRDAVKADIATLQVGDESYAKIYIVVGGEHANHKWNEQLANNLSIQLNKLVPGISRGVVVKSGKGVNGVYNQDLSKNAILIELGGIDSTEVEVNRTIAILAKAVSNLFHQQITS